MKKIFGLGVVAALALSLGACGKGHDLTRDEKAVADHGGLIFANSKGGKFESCAPLDSDKDGYVTCNVRVPMPTEAGGQKLTDRDVLCGYRGEPGCRFKPTK